MKLILEGMYEGCHGDIWRLLEGKIHVVNGAVDNTSSTFKWRLMRCPDVLPLQRLRNREGEIANEIFKGSLVGNVLNLETHNVDDSTFLGFATYEITLNHADHTFVGKSETRAENPDKEAAFTGELDGEFQVVL